MFYKGSSIIMYHKVLSLISNERIIITIIILYNVIIIYYKCFVKMALWEGIMLKQWL